MKSRLATVHAPLLVAVLAAALLLAAGAYALVASASHPAAPPQPAAAISANGWASGWVPIAPGQTLTLTHNLGDAVEDYAVQMWFLDLPLGGLGVHVLGYGGLEGDGLYTGAYWQNLTSTTIEVVRQADDTLTDRVRVVIWTPNPEQQYCTAWAAIGQGDMPSAMHNLGGNPDDYNVQLWFRDITGRIHQQAYGGKEDAGERMGAYWRSLDPTFVSVYRYADDLYVDEFRLCVSVADPPNYDSGWVPITQSEMLTLTHAVGGNVNNYVVNIEFKDVDGPLGIHHAGAGGDFLDPVKGVDTIEHGVHWQRLTNDTIEVVRHIYDPYVDEVRVRIWQREFQVFLPIVLRGY